MLPGMGGLGGQGDPSPEQLLAMLEELQRQGHSLDEISPDLGVRSLVSAEHDLASVDPSKQQRRPLGTRPQQQGMSMGT